MDSNKCDRPGWVTFQVLNQRNPERTKTTLGVREISADGPIGSPACREAVEEFFAAYSGQVCLRSRCPGVEKAVILDCELRIDHDDPSSHISEETFCRAVPRPEEMEVFIEVSALGFTQKATCCTAGFG